MTCGISQMVAGSAKPMCAFPLSGSDLDVFAPIEKVFLMFATKQVNTGTVIEQSFGQGVFIDLTAQNSRNLTYDIDAGWSWDGGVWAKAYPASTLMVPFLIESSATLSASKDKLLLAAKAA